MEVVYHVHILKLCGGSLVCSVHRMVQRKIPDRECLELGIGCFYSALMLVVHLRKAGCKLSAAWARAGDYNDRLLGLYIWVCAVALLAYNQIHIGGVPFGELVGIYLHSAVLHGGPECIGRRLPVVSCNYNCFYRNAPGPEVVDSLHNIGVVGYAEVGPHLLLLYIRSRDAHYDIYRVLHLCKEVHLHIGVKTRQNPGGMEVEKDFAAEFQIELVAVAILYPVKNCLALKLKI